MSVAIYSYKYRPYYGLPGYLIEFFKGSGSEELKRDVIKAMEELDPVAAEEVDNWMVDEIATPISTSMGKVNFSRDGWDKDFIMGGPQELVAKIHEILNDNQKFESLKVDLREYRQIENKK